MIHKEGPAERPSHEDCRKTKGQIDKQVKQERVAGDNIFANRHLERDRQKLRETEKGKECERIDDANGTETETDNTHSSIESKKSDFTLAVESADRQRTVRYKGRKRKKRQRKKKREKTRKKIPRKKREKERKKKKDVAWAMSLKQSNYGEFTRSERWKWK